MSPLASVIRSAIPTYPKVDDNHPLALFHNKFLGKSMKDEETEWQEAQTRIGDQPEDQDQGKGMAKAMDEIHNETINEGCYILDISIYDMIPKKLWIRADYILIFDFFQTHYNKYAKSMDQLKAVPSAVLTGQPGIGKSFWIYYAARRLLAERKAFIWSYQGYFYLFVDEGVYELPDYWRHSDFSSIIWTLVDPDQSTARVLEILIPHGTHLFVMYVTSPAAGRWSRMHKTTQNVVVIMNPWSRREIQQIAHLSPLEGIIETHVNEIFDQLGPIPRLCIDQTSDQLTEYRNQLHEAISKLTTDDILKLTHEASGLTMDAVSQKICILSRQDRDVVNSQVAVAPITDSIKLRLSNQFQNLQRAEKVRLYHFFEKMPRLRAMAGIFH